MDDEDQAFEDLMDMLDTLSRSALTLAGQVHNLTRAIEHAFDLPKRDDDGDD